MGGMVMTKIFEIESEKIARCSDKLSEFIEQARGMQLFSTSATRVWFAGDLYNVDGSRGDPHIDSKNWKPLLESYGIGGDCYADTPPADHGSSHPGFNVGGHMTTNSNGQVPFGGDCYLMPLCHWHNSKSRDGIPFSHARTEMLMLHGYMQGEPAATFFARHPGAAEFSLIYLTPDGLESRSITPDYGRKGAKKLLEAAGATASPEVGLVLRRVETDDGIRFEIADAALPS